MEILRGLSVELQEKINILVFSSMLLIIANALFAHVSEGRRRKWVFPQLIEFHRFKDGEMSDMTRKMDLMGLSPYWFDVAKGGAVRNTISMQSLFLLTGPNGGGKSSLLRSICAAALIGICGLMVPAESAMIPHFDSVMLHMKSYDSPADGKSSFQIEMSELRSLVCGASPRSLVLIDEICRGTETVKGTCIAGSIVETLDDIGCLGIVSTHLHGIFDLPLSTKNVIYKAMGTEVINGRVKPTWKVRDGICRESLAFETAQREGIPEAIIRRAEELYLSMDLKLAIFPEKSKRKTQHFNVDTAIEISCETQTSSEVELFPSGTKMLSCTKTLLQGVEKVVTVICQKKMIELHKKKISSKVSEVTCVSIGAREQPPPSTIGISSVYIMFRPGKRLYVGQTDDLAGRVRTHRLEEGLQNSPFLYVLVPGKSVASELETLLINQLPLLGFRLDNRADGKHRNFGTAGLSAEALSPHQ
ncbi:hypothetical protein Taro_005908 [Colocasia esculenta]|uniref:DNA mismatch repair proteins mutS family domain-containing protein n=1 Tax=Colocasia esculenta TaxID=4460 RepID=A0A843TMB3_COLES|nr:hypothetical protein [Colocasia esculenta]